MATISSSRCPSCTDEGKMKCAGCKAVKYCSEECQAADWPFHKSFCKLFQNIPDRPSPKHRLFVFFPKDGTRPELKWFLDIPMDLDEYNDGKILYPKEVRGNMLTGAKLEKSVYVWFDDDFKRNYQKTNKAVDSVTAKKSTFHWRGPVVVVAGPENWDRLKQELFDRQDLVDMDPLACSDMAAFFVEYFDTSPEQRHRELRRGRKVEAVKATCPGEQALSGAAPYVAVKIPVMHPIFEDKMAEIPSISDGIKMPLVTWRYPKNKNWSTVDNGDCNKKVCHMHKGIDPKVSTREHHLSSSFGYSSFRWDFSPGSVLVMRLDCTPITPEEVDAFGEFCLLHLTQYFQLKSEKDDGEVSEARMEEIKALVVAEASPGKWETYLQDWRKIKAGITDPEIDRRVDGKVRMGLTETDGHKLCYHLLCTHH